MNEVNEAVIATAKLCPVCSRPVPPKSNPGGRPKIYCSRQCAWSAGNALKARSRPEKSRAASRGPLTAFAARTGWALRGDVERLERIFADDRFATNRQQVTAQLRGHLEYAAEVCQDLLSRIDQPTGE